MDGADQHLTGEGESWIIPRPNLDLMRLPIEFKWEVTRRHPYYLRFWELARSAHLSPSNDSQQREQEETAKLILLAIGVSGCPATPTTTFQELGGEVLGEIWRDGAIVPMTYRALVSMLLAGLPQNVVRDLGALFVSASEESGDPTSRLFTMLSRLDQIPHEVLDQAVSRPIVGVNLHAPQKRIVDALAELVRQLKEQEKIQETRRRDDKYAKYLDVWDQREGWTGSDYDLEKEKTLRRIALENSESISTIASQYRSAFRMIVGRVYSPELWARVIGFIKVYDWVLVDELPARYRRSIVRESQSPNPSVVSETRLMSSRSDSDDPISLLNTIGISADELSYAELAMDIQALIVKRKDDDEILTELELKSPDAQALVQYFRERHADSL